jgi:hypothetical protein
MKGGGMQKIARELGVGVSAQSFIRKNRLFHQNPDPGIGRPRKYTDRP